MPRLLVIALLVAAARPSHANPPRLEGAVRVSGAIGHLSELTWAAPGLDLVGSMSLGHSRRARVGLQVGYAPLDNHTFLSDGLTAHAAITAGFDVGAVVRIGAVAAVEYVAFHADPDVLADHAGVDLLARREAVVPVAGAELAYRARPELSLGLFARLGATRVELFREGDQDPTSTGGAVGRARPFLVGVFVEFRVGAR